MSVRALRLFGLSLVFVLGAACTQSASAAEKGEGKGNRGGGLVAAIQKHADELKLTDEQKTKLDALSKDAPKEGEKRGNQMEKVKEILTPEQMTQVKEIMAKERGGKKKEGN